MSDGRGPPRRRGCDFVLHGVPMLDSPQSVRAEPQHQPPPPHSGAHDLSDDDHGYTSLSDPGPLMLPPGRAAAARRHTATDETPSEGSRSPCVTRTPVVVTSPRAQRMGRRISDRQSEIMRGARHDASRSSQKTSAGASSRVTPPTTSGTTNPSPRHRATHATRQPVFSATQQDTAGAPHVKPSGPPAPVRVGRVRTKPQARSSFSLERDAAGAAPRPAVYTAVEHQTGVASPRTVTAPHRSRLEQASTLQQRRESTQQKPPEMQPPSLLTAITGSSSTSSGSVAQRARQALPGQRTKHVDSSSDMSATLPRDRRERSHTSSTGSQSSVNIYSAEGTLVNVLLSQDMTAEPSSGSRATSSTHTRPPFHPQKFKQPVPSIERKDKLTEATAAQVKPRDSTPQHNNQRPSVVQVRLTRNADAPSSSAPHGQAATTAPRVSASVSDNSGGPFPCWQSGDSATFALEGWAMGQDSPRAGSGSRARSGLLAAALTSRESSDEASLDRRYGYDYGSNSTTTSFSTQRQGAPGPAPPLPAQSSPWTSDLMATPNNSGPLYSLSSLSNLDPSSVRTNLGAVALPRHAATELAPANQFPTLFDGGTSSRSVHGRQPTPVQRGAPLGVGAIGVRRTAQADTPTVPAPPASAPPPPVSSDTTKATATTTAARHHDHRCSLDSLGSDGPRLNMSLYQWDVSSPSAGAERQSHHTNTSSPAGISSHPRTTVTTVSSTNTATTAARRETWPLTANTLLPQGSGQQLQQQSATSPQRLQARSVDGNAGQPVATRRFQPGKDRHFSIPSTASGAGATNSNLISRTSQSDTQQRLSTSSRAAGSHASLGVTVVPLGHAPTQPPQSDNHKRS